MQLIVSGLSAFPVRYNGFFERQANARKRGLSLFFGSFW
jgi:hypothetical protein